MENDWKLFYTTNKMYKVNIIKEIMKEQNIEVNEVAKNQTGLPVGDIELYVLEANLDKATEIIQKHPEL
jgi:inosine/xanthosine triphosphate pyrophosphatase family protein